MKMTLRVSQGWVEVDGMMSKALRGFIAFPTATLEGLSHTDLRPVSVFSMVLNTIHILEEREVRRKARMRQSLRSFPEIKNIYCNHLLLSHLYLDRKRPSK